MSAPASPNERKGSFGVLGQRDFLLLWLGAFSAFIGFFTSVVVKSVVAFELTQSNTAVGWVAAARGAAMVTLSLLGGAVADRVSKRGLLVGAQLATAAMFAGLGVLMVRDALTVELLVGSAFLVGVMFAFLGPARQAYAVELVSESMRSNAVATNQVALNASRVGGPALAGYLLAHEVGAAGGFFVMGGLYALAALTHGQLPRPQPRADAATSSVLGDIYGGLRYVVARPHLKALLLYYVFTMMLGFPYVVVLPGLVENALNQPAETVSVLFSTSAVGSLIASVVAAPFADHRHVLLAHRGAGFLFAVSLVWLSLVQDMTMANAAIILNGLATGVVATLNGAVLVRACEPRYIGRVMSLAMLAFGGFGLMGLPFGALADAFGERLCLQVMGASVCLSTLYFGYRISATAAQVAPPGGPTGERAQP